MSKPTIYAGHHVLLPDTAGQGVPIYVVGGHDVDAVALNVQVDEGRGESPRIELIDVITDTIFAANNTGPRRDLDGSGPEDVVPQWEYAGTTTREGYVAAHGLLATVCVSTEGLTAGDYVFRVRGTLNGDTALGLVPVTLVNGSLRISEHEDVDGVVCIRNAWRLAKSMSSQ